MATDGIGASVLRKEDRRFLTGTGTYTDDVSRPSQTSSKAFSSPRRTLKRFMAMNMGGTSTNESYRVAPRLIQRLRPD